MTKMKIYNLGSEALDVDLLALAVGLLGLSVLSSSSLSLISCNLHEADLVHDIPVEWLRQLRAYVPCVFVAMTVHPPPHPTAHHHRLVHVLLLFLVLIDPTSMAFSHGFETLARRSRQIESNSSDARALLAFTNISTVLDNVILTLNMLFINKTQLVVPESKV